MHADDGCVTRGGPAAARVRAWPPCGHVTAPVTASSRGAVHSPASSAVVLDVCMSATMAALATGGRQVPGVATGRASGRYYRQTRYGGHR